MPPLNKMDLPEERNSGVWGRLTRRVGINRPLAWAVGLSVGLFLFLIWLPPYVRIYFWQRIQTQPILASMIVGFGLLALSLLWSPVSAWTPGPFSSSTYAVAVRPGWIC